ncbi:MAG: Sip1-related alpha-galactosidase [Sulfolobales archaeon]
MARVSARISRFSDFHGAIGVEAESMVPLAPSDPLRIRLNVSGAISSLGLTLHPGAIRDLYSQGFRYYNQLAIERSPSAPRPPDVAEYPVSLGEISHREFIRYTPCWAYPYFSRESRDLAAPYTVFLLARIDRGHLALATFSNGGFTGYLWPGPALRLFLGISSTRVPRSWVLSYGFSEDPYEAVSRAVDAASRVGSVVPRRGKKKPGLLGMLGWCSWNALLTDDLSHGRVVEIVGELIKRGVRIGYVIVDDGWQREERRQGMRVMTGLEPDPNKFPGGFKALVEELRGLGIRLIGLWHTINIHWGGAAPEVMADLGAEGFRIPLIGSYAPHYEYSRALELYSNLYRWLRAQGFDFVKVDNQWVIHALYQGRESVAVASKNIELALQAGAYGVGMEILNCMSMTPENYSNFVISNLMRVSMDYVPFWKLDAKLHLLFSVYNSIFYSELAYPDYDMFMTYDPYAMPHIVARILSGGPVYITDRRPEKTNIEVIRKIVMPNGELVSPDEPGLPTRDIIYEDPYLSRKMLKIAAPVRWGWAVGAININRDGVEEVDHISVEILPRDPGWNEYIYYMAIKGEKGVLRRGEKLEISLKELEAEVIILAPISRGKAVIGLKEYLLPPYPIDLLPDGSLRARAPGTLVYYVDGAFRETSLSSEEVIRI